MPVKYHCPKCGRKFVDWGAEKLGFKCPDCPDEDLARVSQAQDRPSRRPTLKRKPPKKTIKLTAVDDEVLVPEIDEGDEEDGEEEEEEEESEYEGEEDGDEEGEAEAEDEGDEGGDEGGDDDDLEEGDFDEEGLDDDESAGEGEDHETWDD